MSFSDEEKLSVTLDILRIAQGKSRSFADALTLKCSLVDYWTSLDIPVYFPCSCLVETMEAGHDISDLVSHGLDLLSNLLLHSSSSSQIRWVGCSWLLGMADVHVAQKRLYVGVVFLSGIS